MAPINVHCGANKAKSTNRHHLMIYLYLFYFFSFLLLTHSHTRTFLRRISFCGELIYCYHLRHYGGHTIHNFVTRALDRRQKQIICACIAIFYGATYFQFFYTLQIKIQKRAHMSSHLIITHLTLMQIFSGDRLLFCLLVCLPVGRFFSLFVCVRVRVFLFSFSFFQTFPDDFSAHATCMCANCERSE